MNRKSLYSLLLMSAAIASMSGVRHSYVEDVIAPDNRLPISHKSGLKYRKKKKIEGRHPEIIYVKGGIIKDGKFIPKNN